MKRHKCHFDASKLSGRFKMKARKISKFLVFQQLHKFKSISLEALVTL